MKILPDSSRKEQLNLRTSFNVKHILSYPMNIPRSALLGMCNDCLNKVYFLNFHRSLKCSLGHSHLIMTAFKLHRGQCSNEWSVTFRWGMLTEQPCLELASCFCLHCFSCCFFFFLLCRLVDLTGTLLGILALEVSVFIFAWFLSFPHLKLAIAICVILPKVSHTLYCILLLYVFNCAPTALSSCLREHTLSCCDTCEFISWSVRVCCLQIFVARFCTVEWCVQHYKIWIVTWISPAPSE